MGMSPASVVKDKTLPSIFSGCWPCPTEFFPYLQTFPSFCVVVVAEESKLKILTDLLCQDTTL